MKRLFLILALIATCFGCDDATVRSHIIDNFVCVYMPQWMGDCQGTEVVSKVNSVLDHGLVEAHAHCEGNTGVPFIYDAKKLIDGTTVARLRTGSQNDATAVCERTEQCAENAFISEGDFCISTQCSGQYWIEAWIDSAEARFRAHANSGYTSEQTIPCTGFNLEAFTDP